MASIQGRLTVWLLGSVVVLFGLHWLVTNRAPQLFTEEYIATRLEHDGENLISGIRFGKDGAVRLDPDFVAPIYLRHGSGHYYLIRSKSGSIKSRSLGDETFNLSLTDQPHNTRLHLQGPGGQPLLVWVAHFEKQGHPLSLAVAEELTTLEQQVSKFRLHFSMVTVALLALLVIIQRVIVRFSLKPLENMGQACRQLEAGEIEKLPEAVPIEVKPLVSEVNRLLGLTQQRLIRSRHSLGNLAHALKTPLSVLSQIVEQNTDRMPAEDGSQARSSLAMIRSTIDRELKRARLAGSVSAGQLFNLDTELPSIIGLLKKVYADRQLDYELAIQQPGIRFGDREDMLELIGNLLDNASKWARHRVIFSASLDGVLTLSVEDDGPGIEGSKRQQLMQRGVRFDESQSGHGLGLSIIRDIISHYDGDVQFLRSTALGGLQVVVTLPFSKAARPL